MDVLSQMRKGDDLPDRLDECAELSCEKREVLQNRAEALVLLLRTCIVSRRKIVVFCFVICVLVCRRGEPQTVPLAVEVQT